MPSDPTLVEAVPGHAPPVGRWGSVRRPEAARVVHGPLGFVGLAVAIFVLAYVAVELAPTDTGIAAWWPAAGLSVLAVAWAPRDRRVLVVVIVVLASGAANLLAGRPAAVALGLALSNGAEAALVGAWLLRGVSYPRLATLDDVARLFTATVLGTVVLGIGAGLAIYLGQGGDVVTTARTVVPSHAAAILVTVPLGMRTSRPRAPGRGVEVFAQWAAVVAATLLVFGPGQTLPISFVTIPFLVWGALRLGTRTMAAQLVLVATLTSWLTRVGGGPFSADLGSGTLATSLVQTYLVVCAVITIPLAVSVAQRRAALEQVAASERLYRQSFSEALLGMLVLRRTELGDGRPPQRSAPGGLDVVELNDVAARMLHEEEAALVGTSWTGRLEAGDEAAVREAVVAMTQGDLAGWHGELSIRSEETMRWVEVALSPLSSSAGDGMFVAQMVDVTARRGAEERLTVQALQDGLTGLGNRTLLRDRIELALRTLPDDGTVGVVLLFCDLDDFKLVNDSAGHSSGDVVLVEVARRLRTLLRADDVAARLGGDEFVVLRPRAQPGTQAEELAAQVLDALSAPLVVAGQPFSLGVSIGIAWGAAGTTVDDLLRDADAAMYAAKREGKRRAVVYSEAHRARAVRAVRVEQELRVALARGELEVFLQPVVDLHDGRWVAAEALVRWQHPTRGLLPPVEFLDVAEVSGLMPEIGAWVLRRSCELAVLWPTGADGGAPAVHVNVSARQLDVPGFSDVVRDVLAATGLPPERLVLEFTETQLDEVSDALLADLAGLRRAGIGLAADDYGTGYSPLTRIIELPLTMIKIDRRFVSGMLDDVRSRAIVTTLVRLGESLGLALVAEGVETAEEAAALRALGCPSAQGYLWSRPVPSDDFVALLAAGGSPRGVDGPPSSYAAGRAGDMPHVGRPGDDTQGEHRT